MPRSLTLAKTTARNEDHRPTRGIPTMAAVAATHLRQTTIGEIRCSGYQHAPGGRCGNCTRMNQECIFQPASSSSTAVFVHVSAVPGGIAPGTPLYELGISPDGPALANGSPLALLGVGRGICWNGAPETGIRGGRRTRSPTAEWKRGGAVATISGLQQQPPPGPILSVSSSDARSSRQCGQHAHASGVFEGSDATSAVTGNVSPSWPWFERTSRVTS
ncbi:uncharacterized protein DNG_05141 [Cephalotrichum gorgonifer]|uniref:Zn(2)-C6 fungal-type domain-containing protein n=1 Tax=Cephalotrichum gorgonifer TaxID=2041049 RepID=A0AAE8MZW1_9PEZI|nr:uncharacterized protein DNG_05141 [Cephalotrichum gorgonifer]